MANDSKVDEIVDRFVAEITDAIRAEVREGIQDELQKFATGLGTKAVKRATKVARRSTKGKKRAKKPCPVDGCTNTAAPRWNMLCRGHSEELSKDEIAKVRFAADAPGGIWYIMKHGDTPPAEKEKVRKAG